MTTNSSFVQPQVRAVTERIRERSTRGRADYLERMDAARRRGSIRAGLSCTNLAHGFAASDATDKEALKLMRWPNVAIVSAYNDMLSAHQPIAMATGVALAHNMFDSALCLGVCDKIVPGLLMGALSFGHLPVLFVPAGPMPSGVPNKEKARIRQLYAEGKVGRDTLLETEAGSYHSAGTCTFYGTANSNQMLMEVMGLHMPGAAFVPPNTPLRDALTAAAAQRAARITALGNTYLPLARTIDEKAVVNAVVGLLATGGSTNHTMHLVAMARCAGISITWDDFSDLSAVVPLLTRIYPNGSADVNRFQMAGGMAFLIRELLGSARIPPNPGSMRAGCRGALRPLRAAISTCCVPPTIRSARMAASNC